MAEILTNNYQDYIRQVEDFPKEGVRFYDMAPLIGNGAIFAALINDIAEPLAGKITKVVGFDARGFIFGGAVAAQLGVGCVMLRKSGKLPGDVVSAEYDLEYGSSVLEIQTDTVNEQDSVLLIDDVIATGGTARAGIELVRKCGASIVEFCSLIDLPNLGGSEKITADGVAVRAFISIGETS
jgi:adenine phosphoribosyltransferase